MTKQPKLNTKTRLGTVVSLIFIASAASAASVGESDRLFQLEATVRELTLQNAKLIAENHRLSNAMKDALSAQRSGTRIVNGCDTDPLARAVIQQNEDFDRIIVVKRWISNNGSQCTKSQLQSIRDSLQTWGLHPVFMREVTPSIDYWINR